MTDGAVTAARLDRVILEGEAPNNLSPFIEADREQAVAGEVFAGRKARPVELFRGQSLHRVAVDRLDGRHADRC